MSTINEVDVEQFGQAIDAITAEPDSGRFTFRAETEWTDALQCITSINDFDQARERIYTQQFEIEGNEPEQIFGKRTAPTAVELLLAALGLS